MDEAEHCENRAFIYSGDIIASGAPCDIVEDLLPDYVLTIEPDDPVQALRVIRNQTRDGILDAEGLSLFGAKVHVNIQNPDEAKSVLFKHGIDTRRTFAV